MFRDLNTSSNPSVSNFNLSSFTMQLGVLFLSLSMTACAGFRPRTSQSSSAVDKKATPSPRASDPNKEYEVAQGELVRKFAEVREVKKDFPAEQLREFFEKNIGYFISLSNLEPTEEGRTSKLYVVPLHGAILLGESSMVFFPDSMNELCLSIIRVRDLSKPFKSEPITFLRLSKDGTMKVIGLKTEAQPESPTVQRAFQVVTDAAIEATNQKQATSRLVISMVRENKETYKGSVKWSFEGQEPVGVSGLRFQVALIDAPFNIVIDTPGSQQVARGSLTNVG